VTGLGLCAAEGIGDALAGGISLPVDAVGVDLQQDRDVMPGCSSEWNQRPAFASSVPPVNDHPLDLVSALEDCEDPGDRGCSQEPPYIAISEACGRSDSGPRAASPAAMGLSLAI
jgi:hypothetical protein